MSLWTVDTLKEYIEALFAEKDKQIALALTSAEKAVTKAEAATDKRLAGMNEFRDALSDQTKTFASAERVDGLQQRLDKLEGRSSGLKDSWGWLVGIAGIAIAAGAFIFK